MSYHFSQGRLLLQNVSDNNWYYLDVRINEEGRATLHPDQTIAFVNGAVDYLSYVLIRANNGIVYKLGLQTNEHGEVDYSWVEAELPFEQIPINLFLKDSTTGLLYKVTGLEDDNDGVVRVNVAQVSVTTGTETQTIPCNCPVEASAMPPESNLTEAGVLEECSIIVTPQSALPRFLIGSGNQERIQGSGDGEKILGS